MNKLDKQLAKIKQKNGVALMTHVIVGYPSIEETMTLVETMAASGVDIVELQIPFSDPLADGPTIMRACETSLAQGTKVADAFVVMKELSTRVTIPLLFMAYYNTVFSYGVEQFCRDANAAGASGLIVPDMPIEEESHEQFYALCKQYNLHAIHVISPASTENRLKKNAAHATGFIYCTASQGITGVRDELDPNLSAYLGKVKEYFSIPLAVGFGISKPEHIHALHGKVDIAVIGSALINLLAETKKEDRINEVRSFLKKLQTEN